MSLLEVKQIPGNFVKKSVLKDWSDPTGWLYGSDIDVSYNKTNRTITLTGDLTYYYKGIKHALTSPWTSSAHDTGNGVFYLYSTDGTNFTWSTTPWDFDDIMVAGANVTASYQFGIKETHGLMPHTVHEELHEVIGSFRESGGNPTAGTYAENTKTDAAVTPGFDASMLQDEDLHTTIPAWTQGTYTTMYIGASSIATFSTTSSFPYLYTVSGYINYNNTTTGALVEGATGKFYNVYQLLIPTTSDVDSQKFRTIMVQPQKVHGSLADAQGEDPRSISLGDLSSALPEYVFYTRITYGTNASYATTGKVIIPTGGLTYITGNKLSQVAVSGFNPSAHNDLTGIQGGTTDEYYHLTAAQATVVANTSGVNTGDQDLSGYLTSATAATTYLKLDGTNDPVTGDLTLNLGLVVNETGNAAGDFRVEGDTNANLLVTSAANDSIGIGAAARSDSLIFASKNSSMDTAGTWQYGEFLNYTATPTTAPTGDWRTYGAYYSVQASGSNNLPTVYGARFNVLPNVTGTVTTAYGGQFVATSTGTSGTQVSTNVGAGQFSIIKSGAGTWNYQTMKIIDIPTPIVSAGALTGLANSNAYGIYIGDISAANATLAYSISTLTGHAVFNENGGAYNFRVESDTNANMLFVDGTNNRVGIGLGTPASELDIAATTGPVLTLTSTTNALNTNDISGKIAFYKTDGSTGGAGIIPYIQARTTNLGGDFVLEAYTGSITTPVRNIIMGGTGTVFNEDGSAAVDFRVESDTKTEMLFVDASANAIGVNNATPTAYLHIGAGSATAGTAPLKLTAGTVNTTPEAGAIEFDGTDYYMNI